MNEVSYVSLLGRLHTTLASMDSLINNYQRSISAEREFSRPWRQETVDRDDDNRWKELEVSLLA